MANKNQGIPQKFETRFFAVSDKMHVSANKLFQEIAGGEINNWRIKDQNAFQKMFEACSF